MKLSIEKLSQNDERWKFKRIGNTTSTIGNFGCYLVSLCMYLRFCGYDYYPDTLNEAFKVSGCYNGDLIIGDKVAAVFNGSFDGIEDYTNTPANIGRIKAILDSGKPVICEVDFNSATYKKDQHFVLAVGYTDSDLIINDPWTGEEYFLTAKYPNLTYPTLEGAVMGIRVYSFPIIPQEDDEVKRILAFLTEKEVLNESAVREMYGAWQDKPNLQKIITDLQNSLATKQSIIQEKDRIISDLQTTIDGLETQIRSYTDFIQDVAQKLQCPPDISEILGQAEQAIQNETKYLKVLEDLKTVEERCKEAESKESLSREALVKSEASNRELKEELEIVKGRLESLQTNYDRLKSIVANKKPPSIISYLLWRTVWREKSN